MHIYLILTTSNGVINIDTRKAPAHEDAICCAGLILFTSLQLIFTNFNTNYYYLCHYFNCLCLDCFDRAFQFPSAVATDRHFPSSSSVVSRYHGLFLDEVLIDLPPESKIIHFYYVTLIDKNDDILKPVCNARSR